MIALSYLIFFGIYIFLMLAVIRRAWRKGFEKGSRTRASVYAALGFLAVYLPIFWNHIPVTLAHKAMCDNDAGYIEYVPVTKWIDENRERLSALSKSDVYKSKEAGNTRDGYSRDIAYGGLIASDIRNSKFRKFSINFYKLEGRTVEVASGRVLNSRVDYTVGSSGDVRFWLIKPGCFSRENSPILKSSNLDLAILKEYAQ